MSWSNIEVGTVELVQDMSYQKLVERMKSARSKGINSIIKELNNNFDMAVKAVERSCNIDECIMQCDESIFIVITNLFLFLDVLKEDFGLSMLSYSILEVIVCECNDDNTNRNFKKMEQKCKEEFVKCINKMEQFGNEEKAKQLKKFLKDSDNKSFFEKLVDSIIRIVCCAEKIAPRNGKYETAVKKVVYLYANSEREKIQNSFETSWKKMLGEVLLVSIDMYNSKHNKSLLTSPFSCVLNGLV